MRARRSCSILLVAAALAGASGQAGPAAAAPPRSTTTAHSSPVDVPPGATAYLARARHGSAAVDRLGDELPEVAALNDMTADELESLLLEDSTAWVHGNGSVFFVDAAPEPVSPAAAATAPYPYGQTFSLHSKPGSSKTIYLDFDGEYVGGTQWNTSTFPAQTHPAFSLDSDPTTFSTAEQDLVQSVWQRVSEDYAPFDVDVTTADPGPEALRRTTSGDTVFGTRALITPSTTAAAALCNSGCGGIAFISSFAKTSSDTLHPAWIFPQLLSNDTKSIAEAVSHEVGHNLGLHHDGRSGSTYYDGQGSWAPIMGSGYSRPVVQWSKGEYTGADNAEDDLAVIAANGLSPVADDHGGSIATATSVTSSDRSATGVIGTSGDQDYLAFGQGCAGPVTVSATPAPTSPDLDVRLRLLAADGTQLALSDPASATVSRDVASGLPASAQVTVAAGSVLYAEVDGVGAGDTSSTGYSDYASLGRYTVTSTGCNLDAPAVLAFASASQSVAEDAGTAQLTVARTGNTTRSSTVDYAATGGTADPATDFALAPGTLTFAAGETTKSIPVTIEDDATVEGSETVEVTLSAPGTGATVGAVSRLTLTIDDDDDAPPAPAYVGFSRVVRQVDEDSGQVELTVTRTGSTAVASTVRYERTGGSASTLDALLDSGTLTFEPGQTQRSVTLTVVDDESSEPAESVQVSLMSPSDGTVVTGVRSATTLTVRPSDQQPDAMVSTRRSRGFVGDEVFNGDGVGQTRTSSATRGQARSFFVRVVNDGAATNRVRLSAGRPARGATATYAVGGADVTATLTGPGGGYVDLEPAQAILVEVTIRLDRTVKPGAVRTTAVTATWTGDSVRRDVARASVKVVRN